MSSTDNSSPRPGHLDLKWEIAVVSSFVIIFVVAISVVICQVRRQNHHKQQQRNEENQTRNRRRKGKPVDKTGKQTVSDPERGEKHREQEDEDDFVGEEDEKLDDRESKRNSGQSDKPTLVKSETSRPKQHRSSRVSSPYAYFFEQPPRKPPKYYQTRP